MGFVHWRYLLKTHIKALLAVIFIVAFIIFIFTFTETLRRTTVSLEFLMLITLYRLPYIMTTLFPYIYLISTSLTLESLASSRELIVFHASGYSMRQILSPFLCLAGSLSVAWFFALQPFSAYLNHEIQIKEQHYFGMPITSSTRTNLWLYQRPSPSQGILLHVGHMQDSICSDVSIYLFLQNGVLTEKIFAKTLYFTPGAWILSQGTIFKMNNLEYQTFTERRFENTLDANKILLSLAPPKDIGMYDLFSIMKVRRKNHLYEEGHTLALHTLGAKSVLIFFMVLVAGCFQTKHSRLKKSISIAKTLLCCLFLHFFMDIFHSLGKQGIILPFWASWVPIFLTGACAFACLSWKGER